MYINIVSTIVIYLAFSINFTDLHVRIWSLTLFNAADIVTFGKNS